MKQPQSKADFLEYSYSLDLDNPLGRMTKNFMLDDVSSALEMIADSPRETIDVELISGRKEEYRLFVVDKTPSLLRMIDKCLWLDILLPPVYTRAYSSLPTLDEDPEYFSSKKEELDSRAQRRIEKYQEVLERFSFQYNSISPAFLPDEVRERVYVGIQ